MSNRPKKGASCVALSCSLLARCRLQGDFFDLIDCDSFGASTLVVGAALSAVRWGGLVCLTHTAGGLLVQPPIVLHWHARQSTGLVWLSV